MCKIAFSGILSCFYDRKLNKGYLLICFLAIYTAFAAPRIRFH